MFTGLIEEVGRIAGIVTAEGKRRITIDAPRTSSELKKGDSVAVSGVCLTAVELLPGRFGADLAEETWLRTSFSHLREGSLVNLELPVRANERLGGHIVQGHVDGVGTFLGLESIPGAEDFWLRIELPEAMERYVVYKGSLAVEGISLTVASVQGRQVTIAVIPHTCEATNLKSLQPGGPVNLETDLIAKYVEKMIGGERAEGALSLEHLVRQEY
ncbi:MAG: riboflavin synthase [Candidatus Korobacteraceae bacterium]